MTRVQSRVEQLDELLGTSIAAIDIPPAVRARAIARYDEVSAHLAGRSPGGGEIYTQGSFRLGTVVGPVSSDGEYDMDLVYCRDARKESITQSQLKQEAGVRLASYVDSAPSGEPKLSSGKRCLTLDYPGEPFHMDVLPAIPNAEARPNGILLADRELREWQKSNPIAYSDWFRGQMATELIMLREAAAVAKQMDVESVPENELKTTLQRTIQALKRHRDLHFFDDAEDAPASIIITTLAARAYAGGSGLFEVVSDITGRAAGFVERRDGVYWVANPVQEGENFADRWRGRPRRAQAFFDWLETAHADFTSFGEDLGMERVIEKMSRSLGEAAAKEAGEHFGVKRTAQRNTGVLGITGSGALGIAQSRPVPRHTFHGDASRPTGT